MAFGWRFIFPDTPYLASSFSVLAAEIMIRHNGLLEMLARVVFGFLADIEMGDRTMIPHHSRPYLAPGPFDDLVCLCHIYAAYFLLFADCFFFFAAGCFFAVGFLFGLSARANSLR